VLDLRLPNVTSLTITHFDLTPLLDMPASRFPNVQNLAIRRAPVSPGVFYPSGLDVLLDSLPGVRTLELISIMGKEEKVFPIVSRAS
jgi:hypothetical protein